MRNKLVVCIVIVIAVLAPWSAVLSSASSVSSFTYSSSSDLLNSSSPNVDASSNGYFILNATSSYAEALYKSPVAIYDATNRALHSFATAFTFLSNSTNGTLAFVIVPQAAGNLTDAENGISIEFSTVCGGADPSPDNHTFSSWGNRFNGYGGRGGGWSYNGYGPGGPGRFGVVGYVNGSALPAPQVTWDFNGTDWSHDNNNNASVENRTSCSIPNPNSYPNYLYQVVVEYNATSGQLLVGSPTCGGGPRVLNFSVAAAAAAGEIFSADPHIGFVAGAGVYNISGWSFNTNLSTDVFTSLALGVSITGSGGGGGGGDFVNGGGDGPYSKDGGHRGGLSTGAKIGIAVAAAVLGAGILLCLFLCLCRRSRRNRPEMMMKGVPVTAHSSTTATTTTTTSASRTRGLIPDHVVMFDAQKPHKFAAEPPPGERETAPLTTNTSVTTSWLPPVVAPR